MLVVIRDVLRHLESSCDYLVHKFGAILFNGKEVSLVEPVWMFEGVTMVSNRN
jgi:hypothetical protein